jgi:predicted PP-loop superfamily ATPase
VLLKYIIAIIAIVCSISVSAQQSGNYKDVQAIGELRVVMCAFAGGKFSTASDKALRGVSEKVFSGYIKLSHSIPVNQQKFLSDQASDKLKNTSIQEQLNFIIECAQNPIARKYI